MTTPGPQRPIRVMLVDDDPLVRNGLMTIINGEADLQVVAEASDGAEVVTAHHAHHPDIVLMDMRMERVDGITAIRHLQAQINPPKVIAMTSFEVSRYVYESLEAGADGFLYKDTAPDGIIAAIRSVMAGEAMLSPRATKHVLKRYAHAGGAQRYAEANHALQHLSSREREVADGVWRELTNEQIARRMGIGLATVKTHISAVMAKLDVPTRVGIALIVERASGPTQGGTDG